MPNTYKWVISQLECYPEHEGKENVVFTIHWRRQADDGAGHVGDVYGAQAVTLDPNAPFTPFDQLTQAQVESWLESSMTIEQLAAMNDALDKQIADQINPPVTRPALPWAAE